MINFKSNIISAPFREGGSLNELACLSMESSSLVNYLKLKNVLESVEEGSTVYLYRPEAYLHPQHHVKINNLICKMFSEGINFTLNVYSNNESLLLILGSCIEIRKLNRDIVSIELEEEDGIIGNYSFNEDGIISELPLGYFSIRGIVWKGDKHDF